MQMNNKTKLRQSYQIYLTSHMQREIFSEEQILKPTKQLLQNNEISQIEYQTIVQQCQNTSQRKLIHDFVSSSSIKNRLLLYIKSQSHCQSQKNIQNTEQILSTKSIKTEDTSKSGIDSSKSLAEPKRGGKSSEIPSFESITILKQLQNMEEIDIESLEINPLDFSPCLYVPFTLEVLSQTPYFSTIQIPKQKLTNFIHSLVREYQRHSNPYHNFQHGLMVMHSCYLLGKMERASKLLSSLDYFTLVFSGLCHDAGHTGFNNDFQTKIMSEKALIWNDQSVLQNYHAYISMKLLLTEQNNFLEAMNQSDFKQFRKMLISNILATDMKDHAKTESIFQIKLKDSSIYTPSEQSSKSLTSLIMHASDFASNTRKMDTARAWGKRINAEFSNQYREEQRRGLTRTQYFRDLDVDLMAANKSYKGFLNHFVKPLFKLIHDFQFPNKLMVVMLSNIEGNQRMYEQQLALLAKQK